jgi:hypothetical protein
MFVTMQHMTVIACYLDHPFIFQNKQCVVKKNIFLFMIEIVVLINANDAMLESLTDKLKCFCSIQFTNEGYYRNFIKPESVKQSYINIMSLEQANHMADSFPE